MGTLAHFDLRDYQREGIDAVLSALHSHRAVLFVAATGTGKTQMFVKIAEHLRPQLGPVLVLAHREELIRQAEARVRECTDLSVEIEMADNRAGAADVVIGSVQTLSRAARLERFAPDAFGLVVVDEAHHTPATSYRTILDYFVNAKVIGCTATPDRLDGQGLGGIFDVCAFQYEIRDAIEDGWLVPIRQQRVIVDHLDLSAVRRTAGDLNEGDLQQVMTTDASLHGVAGPLVRHAGNRPTLVFGVSIAHAQALAEVIGFYADAHRVAVLVGSDDRDERRQTLQAFAAGEIQYLVNCMLFSEGYDQPRIACVAMARPTSSRALYAQAIGRGTRPAPDKRDLLVLDFVGNSGRHRLVNTFDVLSGARDAGVEQRAQQLMNTEDVTMLDALATAEAEIAMARRRAIQVNVAARVIDVDPFDVLGVRPAPGRWGGVPMTDKQRVVIERAGIPTAGLDRGQASTIIDQLRQRTEAGRCTYKQARTLLRHGYDPDVSFAEATRIITVLAANGWRRPSPGVMVA
jgi:superfamily II DNA or RNA helicase